jgi:hypothetical protein
MNYINTDYRKELKSVPGTGQNWRPNHVSSDFFYTLLCVTGFLDIAV